MVITEIIITIKKLLCQVAGVMSLNNYQQEKQMSSEIFHHIGGNNYFILLKEASHIYTKELISFLIHQHSICIAKCET